MKALIIESEDNSSDMEMFIKLAKRLGLKITMLSDEELEDKAIYQAMLKADRNEIVSEEDVMKALGR